MPGFQETNAAPETAGGGGGPRRSGSPCGCGCSSRGKRRQKLLRSSESRSSKKEGCAALEQLLSSLPRLEHPQPAGLPERRGPPSAAGVSGAGRWFLGISIYVFVSNYFSALGVFSAR